MAFSAQQLAQHLLSKAPIGQCKGQQMRRDSDAKHIPGHWPHAMGLDHL